MIPFFAALAVLTSGPVTSSIDELAFTVPAGFEITTTPDHVNFRRVDSTNWLLFGIYEGRAAGGEPRAEFSQDWKEFFQSTQVPAPQSRPVVLGAGLNGHRGSALTSVGFVELIDVSVAGKVVSILIESGNAEGFTTYRQTIADVLASLSLKNAPKHLASPQRVNDPKAAEPRPTFPETGIATIHASDLVGVWDHGSSSGTTYRQLATGAYAGAVSHFFATEYTLGSDGTVIARFCSTRPAWNSTDRGTWAIQDGLLVLSLKQRDPEPLVKRFQIVSLTTNAGQTRLKLASPGEVIAGVTPTDDWYRQGDK